MSNLTKQQIEQAIATYQDPYLEQNLVEANAVKQIELSDNKVSVEIELPYPSEYLGTGISQMLQVAIANLIEGEEEGKDASLEVSVNVGWKVEANKSHDQIDALKEVKNLIAVSSGKGGVGKSTVAANLAMALAKDGAKVGLLDGDIHGPSVSMMFGVPEGTRPQTIENKWFVPVEAHGVKTMSMAYLVTEKTPMVWRGPMASGALQQLLTQTQWGELDYLIIDMPPGTGDIQLTLSQKAPISGAVVVTTPQDVALLDAQKGVEMFRKVNVPVLGVVENMALHICSQCGHLEHIFGEGGADRIAEDYQTEVLVSLPLSKYIREQADQGVPVVADDEMSEVAHLYRTAARNMAARLAQNGTAAAMPSIQITED